MLLSGVGEKIVKEILRKVAHYQIQMKENDKKTATL